MLDWPPYDSAREVGRKIALNVEKYIVLPANLQFVQTLSEIVKSFEKQQKDMGIKDFNDF
jgi:hypothetical protein